MQKQQRCRQTWALKQIQAVHSWSASHSFSVSSLIASCHFACYQGAHLRWLLYKLLTI